MNRYRTAFAAATCIVVLSVLTACASTGKAAGTAASATTATGRVDAVTYTTLQNLESALGEQGRGSYKDVFGDLELDDHGGVVKLYATDDVRARGMVKAAADAHPGIDAAKVVIIKSKYARKDVDPVIKKIGDAAQAKTLPYVVYTAQMAPRASGIEVTTDKGGAASTALKDALAALADGIPVTVAEGPELQNLPATTEPLPATMSPHN
ncbi:hypothetical protein ACFQ2M_05625 [Kitasatospora saccharophila]|uniref:hypothetical protein n=1 Tax=Kitasatospora saccharophila TaxID=407973 RepID=UPI0031D08CB5